MTASNIRKGSVTVDKGVRLNYLEAGRGHCRTLVLVPGWSQTAEQFRFQLEGLSDRYRVIAFDLRGHGDSDKPDHGYRIQRLAHDLHQALAALDLRDVTILGHSMGCSVLWCYFDLFGADRIARYVFCDQASFLTTDPAWTAEQTANHGSIFTPETVSGTANALRGADGAVATEGFLRTMATEDIDAGQFRWIVEVNLKMPRAHAATLLYNHSHQDWRDVLPRIDRPSLFIGGKASLVPTTCIAWNASQVPGAKLEIFEVEEKGSHFMFIENPGRFNEVVAGFVG
jgi:non-heme chloroperoxidase